VTFEKDGIDNLGLIEAKPAVGPDRQSWSSTAPLARSRPTTKLEGHNSTATGIQPRLIAAEDGCQVEIERSFVINGIGGTDRG